MVEFQKHCNLQDSIQSFIGQWKSENGLDGSDFVHARLISQEKDGSILYTWTDLPPPSFSKTGQPSTHVGLYSPETDRHQVVWIHNQDVKIVSCSISPDHSLLAFTTVMGENSRSLYTGFMVELQTPENRVFALNLQRPSFLKLQFLYLASSGAQRDSEGTAHLLVLLHKESIGLYHISLTRIGKKKMMMKGQPRTEQLAGKFVWCQWDGESQCLHYVSSSRSSSGAKSSKFHSLQFLSGGKHCPVLSLPLDLPLPYIRTSSKSRYRDLPLCAGIPDPSMHMTVLMRGDGGVCICFQQQTSRNDTNQELPKVSSISYFVVMVHHGCTLQCHAPDIPHSVASTSRLFFCLLGDRLFVYLPGYFVHLLNVSIDCDPSFHLILNITDKSWTPTVDNAVAEQAVHAADLQTDTEGQDDRRTEESLCSTRVSLSGEDMEEDRGSEAGCPVADCCCQHRSVSHLYRLVSSAPGGGCQCYSGRTGQVWVAGLSERSVLQHLAACSWQSRLAALHLLLCQHSSHSSLEQVFKVICCSPTSTIVQAMMAEYLVAGTFARLRKQHHADTRQKKLFPAELFHILPQSTISPQTEQYERAKNGDRLTSLCYRPCPGVQVSVSSKALQAPDCQWNLLHQRVTCNPARFPLRKMEGLSVGEIKDKLTYHLAKHLRKENRSSAKDIAKEFLSHQVQQCLRLYRLLCQVQGPSNQPGHHLSRSDLEKDYCLFELMERAYAAAEDWSFPLPEEFSTGFTSLGYHCLNSWIFLQYVDAGILRLSDKFAISVIAGDTSEDKDQRILKFQILSRLPYKTAVAILNSTMVNSTKGPVPCQSEQDSR